MEMTLRMVLRRNIWTSFHSVFPFRSSISHIVGSVSALQYRRSTRTTKIPGLHNLQTRFLGFSKDMGGEGTSRASKADFTIVARSIEFCVQVGKGPNVGRYRVHFNFLVWTSASKCFASSRIHLNVTNRVTLRT